MTARDAAQSYIRRGWKPIPVGFKSKRPTQLGWQRRGVTEANLDIIFPEGKPLNVGVILGDTSGGLTDIHLDCPEAIALAAITLPHTGAIFGCESKPRSHFLYCTQLAATCGKATQKFTDPNNQKTLVEVRIGGSDAGAQTVFPGSFHESGEEITWVEDGEPGTVDGDVLLGHARLLASLCLMARYWPGIGGRHDAALIVGGFLSRCGYAPSQIKCFVEAVANVAGCEDGEGRAADAEDAANAQLDRLFGRIVADQIAVWLDHKREGLAVPHAPNGAL